MDYGKIRQALETRLAAYSLGLPIIYENTVAEVEPEITHLRCYQLNAETRPLGIGSGRHYSGLFQINIFSPVGIGPQQGDYFAGRLALFFESGSQLFVDDIRVVLEEPYFGTSQTKDGWYIIPLYVCWFSLVGE